MRVTKAQIVKALREEPLRGGRWITSGWRGGCSVCALGAVIRQLGAPRDWEELIQVAECLTQDGPIGVDESNDYTGEGAADLVQRGLPWNGLSVAFEALWIEAEAGGWDVDARVRVEWIEEWARTRIIEWVEEHFPDEVEVEI